MQGCGDGPVTDRKWMGRRWRFLWGGMRYQAQRWEVFSKLLGKKLSDRDFWDCSVLWVAGASLLGEEEVLAFLHDLQQNQGDEGRTINQAGGGCLFWHKGWVGWGNCPVP